MAELEEVEIDIFGPQKYKTYRVVSSRQISCNIIERASFEALQRPWTRSACGINYDFGDYASPPLGRAEVHWGWKGGATSGDMFIVVEQVKGTSCGIILGSIARQRPVVEPTNEVYTFTVYIRSKGTSSYLSSLSKLADDSVPEQQQEKRERAKLATERNADEKAQDDAKNKERRAKKKKEEQDHNPRA
jgi:hypothetical protein